MKKFYLLGFTIVLTLAMALLGGCSGQDAEQEAPDGQLEQEANSEDIEDGPWISDEEWASLQNYGDYDLEFGFFMPGANGFEAEGWSLGLGLDHEFALGLPYQYLGGKDRPAEDLVAYNWETVSYSYFDGFHVVSFGDLKTKEVMEGQEPSPCFIQYISTTQPDCKTFRGIHVGNTVEELMEAYPEIQAYLDYANHAAEAEAEGEVTGVADHDTVWMYLPEVEPGDNPNRSILFMTKDDVIVQIGMADGLDGQIWSPVWTGAPQME